MGTESEELIMEPKLIPAIPAKELNAPPDELPAVSGAIFAVDLKVFGTLRAITKPITKATMHHLNKVRFSLISLRNMPPRSTSTYFLSSIVNYFLNRFNRVATMVVMEVNVDVIAITWANEEEKFDVRCGTTISQPGSIVALPEFAGITFPFI